MKNEVILEIYINIFHEVESIECLELLTVNGCHSLCPVLFIAWQKAKGKQIFLILLSRGHKQNGKKMKQNCVHVRQYCSFIRRSSACISNLFHYCHSNGASSFYLHTFFFLSISRLTMFVCSGAIKSLMIQNLQKKKTIFTENDAHRNYKRILMNYSYKLLDA